MSLYSAFYEHRVDVHQLRQTHHGRRATAQQHANLLARAASEHALLLVERAQRVSHLAQVRFSTAQKRITTLPKWLPDCMYNQASRNCWSSNTRSTIGRICATSSARFMASNEARDPTAVARTTARAIRI